MARTSPNENGILSHISNVSTKTLTLSEEKTGRPYATEFVSGVGSEVCTIFEPAVPLEGKVD